MVKDALLIGIDIVLLVAYARWVISIGKSINNFKSVKTPNKDNLK